MSGQNGGRLAQMRTAMVRGANWVLHPFKLQLLRTEISVGTNRRRVGASLAVFEALNHRIQSGPFEGTNLSPKFAWGDANVGAVVLGCYEAQLFPAFEELIATEPDVIVNVGSAEGTYAVGLARRLPQAMVIAVDVEPTAADAARENAVLNGVASQIEVVLGMSPAGLESRLLAASRPGVVIDCEGCELAFLDPISVPSLAKAHILVEVHELLVPGIGAMLRDRFNGTHDVEVIEESGRDPHQYEVLRSMPSIDKWLVVCEGRQDSMEWLWCRPKISRSD
jgi:hypothetical protein